MKPYVTYTSPYARLARIVVMEKDLEDRVEIIEAKTRTRDSPYYQVNPSGRVPYLVDDTGVGMEDSQLICAYLDSLDGNPRFHAPLPEPTWHYLRLEFMTRSMCDSISVWTREMSRPAGERSPTVLAHEMARSQRMADIFERLVDDLPLQAPIRILRWLSRERATAGWMASSMGVRGSLAGRSPSPNVLQYRGRPLRKSAG